VDEIATLRRDNEQLSRMYAEAMLTIRCLSGDTSDEEQADEESDEEENADAEIADQDDEEDEDDVVRTCLPLRLHVPGCMFLCLPSCVPNSAPCLLPQNDDDDDDDDEEVEDGDEVDDENENEEGR
jgi:hypothetical protein